MLLSLFYFCFNFDSGNFLHLTDHPFGLFSSNDKVPRTEWNFFFLSSFPSFSFLSYFFFFFLFYMKQITKWNSHLLKGNGKRNNEISSNLTGKNEKKKYLIKIFHLTFCKLFVFFLFFIWIIIIKINYQLNYFHLKGVLGLFVV